ncbi:FMN-binding protein [Desulfitobacterium hafniense]|uniref:FMN-binding protein n=1 Tax=Desulfitobacterium hafniense TaxID=49338 RepID=UPI00031793BC|nr:4Fe-4S binding protein [Desulfitobacterium hafniense]
MNKLKKYFNKMFVGLALLSLVIALIYQQDVQKKDVLGVIQTGEPSAVRFEALEGNYPSYKLWDVAGNSLGYGVMADASGYGGKLNVIVIVEDSGLIKSVILVDNHETPLYLKKVVDSGFLNAFYDHPVEDNTTGVDTVSGATVTSKGILTAVQKGIVQIGNNELGLHISTGSSIIYDWKDLTVVGLILLAIISAACNLRKLRPWVLVLSVLIIGFLTNASLTLGNFSGLISGNFPIMVERPVWYILVPGLLIITIVWGRNIYCSWLCPFGAVQEGVFYSLNLINFSPSANVRSRVAQARWLMLWLAVMLALVFNNSGIASYEPFAVFFDGRGNTAQWVMTIIVVLFSIAQLRFWCQGFCPVGLILNFTARLKRKVKILMKQKRQDNSEPTQCTQCSNTKCAQKDDLLSSHDKILIGITVLVNALILMVLIQNIIQV